MPFRFSPPSYATGESVAPGMDRVTAALCGHFVAHRRGVSVRKVGGAYVEAREPYLDDLLAADVVYLGGHFYEVSDAEAAALTAAGYGDQLEAL